ncbi:glycine cleavage system protein GcvH [bacterium]|nr:glycine cleavage system protein GcvH [bacterium]
MSEVKKGYIYTETDEWVKVDGNEVLIGITDYAQHHLGDIVFVEITAEGKTIKKGDVLTTIESVKSANDVFSPVSGKVLAMNTKLEEDSGLINKDPYNEGWIARIQLANPEELSTLMQDEDYHQYRKE